MNSVRVIKMNGNITGENDERVGLYVDDNNDAEHWIEMEFDGEIKYHEQDAYPDHPDDRTNEELKSVMQARKFARYHVYQERGYETLPPNERPERLILATLVVANLSTEAFEQQFGDLYQQLKSYSTDQEPVVDLPDGLSEDNYYLYAKELYLGFDDDALQSTLEAIDEASLEVILETVGNSDPAVDEALTALGINPVDAEPSDLSERWIEAISDVLVQWRIGESTHRQNAELDVDREPDVGIEIHPHDPGSIEEFQTYVVDHLRCQLRDAYVQTGQTPPEYAQIQGPGRDLFTMMYQKLSSMQNYHDPDAEIDWGLSEHLVDQ